MLRIYFARFSVVVFRIPIKKLHIKIINMIKNIQKILATACCFIFCCNANATTLNSALHDAIKNSSEIKLEKSRLNQVKASKGDAISDFLPDVNATYQRGRQKNDAVGLDRGDLDKANTQDVKQLNFNQPIFSGLSGYNNLKAVKSNISAAKEYYKSKKLDVILQATESYLKLFEARNLVNIKKYDEKNTRKILSLIRGRNRSGQVGGSEVIKYQTLLAKASSDVLSAKKEVFDTQGEYEKIFGKIDNDLFLPKTNKKRFQEGEEELIKLAVTKSPILKSYAFKVKSAKYARKKSKGKFAPTVEIAASASEQNNVTYLNNRDLRSQSVYLNLRVPLFQKGTEYSGLDIANKDLTFAKKEYISNKENIIKEVKQAYREVSFYGDLIQRQKRLIKLTKHKIANISQQVNVGEGDIINLLESKLELSEITIQQLRNEADYVLSYYKLMILTGKLRV